jgi:hypothetical protein
MRRIVLPFVSASTAAPITQRINLIAVATTDVRVAVEIVIAVNIYVIAAPTTPPTPAAAPEGSHREANPERNRSRAGVVAPSWVVDWRIRVVWSAPNDNGVVAWKVNNLGVRLLDDDDLLSFDDLCFYLLLLG